MTAPVITKEGAVRCDDRLELRALPGLPLIAPGDDVAALIAAALARAEGRFFDLSTVEPSPRAQKLGREVDKDERLVELILREASELSRQARGVLVVRHRLGFIGANSSIDCSNAVPASAPAGSGPWVLLLPTDPDGDAERIRQSLQALSGARIGVVVTDSLGRPFRLGTVGAAIGVAGFPALWDRRGEADIYGRKLEQTITALADQVAAAADLVAGQAAEGRPVIHVRGLHFPIGDHRADELYRPPEEDLYA